MKKKGRRTEPGTGKGGEGEKGGYVVVFYGPKKKTVEVRKKGKKGRSTSRNFWKRGKPKRNKFIDIGRIAEGEKRKSTLMMNRQREKKKKKRKC